MEFELRGLKKPLGKICALKIQFLSPGSAGCYKAGKVPLALSSHQ